MSAFAKVTTQINNLPLLKQSMDDLGMKYESDKKSVKFYGKNPMGLDIYVAKHHFGFVKSGETYDLVGDSDHQPVFNKILQKYSENRVREQARQQGYQVESVEQLENGEIKLHIKRRSFA